jgi:hypothetical protein
VGGLAGARLRHLRAGQAVLVNKRIVDAVRMVSVQLQQRCCQARVLAGRQGGGDQQAPPARQGVQCQDLAGGQLRGGQQRARRLYGSSSTHSDSNSLSAPS